MTLEQWAKETAERIIKDLLREESWEVLDHDQTFAINGLIESLKDAVNERLG